MTGKPDFSKHMVNLASRRLGAKVQEVSDDFFAEAKRMLQDSEPTFKPDLYDEHGKWMDGWESRRRREPGHDYAVVQLGTRGIVHGLDIDTRHFTGNYPPQASVEGMDCGSVTNPVSGDWEELLPISELGSDRQHFFSIKNRRPLTHVRLNIFPDGGIARLRVYGDPHPDWSGIDMSQILEVSSIELGGRIAGYNDAHYGMPWVILTSGRGKNMGDGWETRRRREPGHDWILVRLGATAEIEKVEVDTAHFKGNYPDRCSLQASMAGNESDEELAAKAEKWPELLSPQKLSMDQQHFFQKQQLQDLGPVNCVRLNIFPDGGISRLRIFGRPQF